MKLNFFTQLFNNSSSDFIENHKSKLIDPLNEENSKILIEGGKIKAESKNYKGALDDFTKAIELDPKSISGYWERSKIKRILNDKNGADKDFQKGNILYENLDSGLQANDDGYEFYQNGDYKNAIKCFNKAIPLIPSITTIYLYRGLSKEYLNDLKGAMEDYDKCILLNASNKSDAFLQKSKLKSNKLNDKKGALEDLNMAIKIEPKNAEYYYNRSKLLDNYDALQDLSVAIELEPYEADHYLSRSFKHHSMNDYDGSILDISKYIELNPKNGNVELYEAYLLRAMFKQLAKDYEGGLKDIDKSISLNPFNSKAFLDRGLANDYLKNSQEALNDFSQAIELDSQNADAFFHRGCLRQDMGIEDEGIMDVLRAKALGYED